MTCLVSALYEVRSEHIDVIFDPTHSGVEEVCYHPVENMSMKSVNAC